MGRTSHVEDDKKDLVKEMHRLARLGVRLVDFTSGGVSVHPSSESFFVVEVKKGQHLDPVLIELMDYVLMKLKYLVLVKMSDSFALGNDDILRYQDSLCVPDVDDLLTMVIEDHGSRYSINQGSTKMYHDLKQIYWGMA